MIVHSCSGPTAELIPVRAGQSTWQLIHRPSLHRSSRVARDGGRRRRCRRRRRHRRCRVRKTKIETLRPVLPAKTIRLHLFVLREAVLPCAFLAAGGTVYLPGSVLRASLSVINIRHTHDRASASNSRLQLVVLVVQQVDHREHSQMQVLSILQISMSAGTALRDLPALLAPQVDCPSSSVEVQCASFSNLWRYHQECALTADWESMVRQMQPELISAC